MSANCSLVMQRGTALIFLAIFTILTGVLALMLTDIKMCWAIIALGAVIGSSGGISISQRARG
jgi:hypothetical protein